VHEEEQRDVDRYAEAAAGDGTRSECQPPQRPASALLMLYRYSLSDVLS
jgi:hypothetical protein